MILVVGGGWDEILGFDDECALEGCWSVKHRKNIKYV